MSWKWLLQIERGKNPWTKVTANNNNASAGIGKSPSALLSFTFSWSENEIQLVGVVRWRLFFSLDFPKKTYISCYYMVFQVISWLIFHEAILFFVRFVICLSCFLVCLTICYPESHLSCEFGRQVETSWCRICTADRWRLRCVRHKEFDWYQNKYETFLKSDFAQRSLYCMS